MEKELDRSKSYSQERNGKPDTSNPQGNGEFGMSTFLPGLYLRDHLTRSDCIGLRPGSGTTMDGRRLLREEL